MAWLSCPSDERIKVASYLATMPGITVSEIRAFLGLDPPDEDFVLNLPLDLERD